MIADNTMNKVLNILLCNSNTKQKKVTEMKITFALL